MGVDFTFIYWYYHTFVGVPPFGFDGIDIKSFAMAALRKRTLPEVSRTELKRILEIPDYGFSHDPLEDAEMQAALFFGLLHKVG